MRRSSALGIQYQHGLRKFSDFWVSLAGDGFAAEIKKPNSRITIKITELRFWEKKKFFFKIISVSCPNILFKKCIYSLFTKYSQPWNYFPCNHVTVTNLHEFTGVFVIHQHKVADNCKLKAKIIHCTSQIIWYEQFGTNKYSAHFTLIQRIKLDLKKK